jgi:NAD(P)-dependent dehydrogenase (short-subunit alcohol dehydrogenase family)
LECKGVSRLRPDPHYISNPRRTRTHRGEEFVKDLNGRVAVVTGGASGIGRGMAEIFLERGMKVVVADLEAKALAATVAELKVGGGEVVGVECDVSNSDSVERLRDESLSHFGAVHVLCNNAGVAGGASGATWEAPQADWDWVMGVNLMGVIYGIRHFVPVMIDQGVPAHVVNTSSMAGLVHGMGIYGVTKHAVVALSESMFSELKAAGHEIGVSVLCPGWVRTRILESERNRPEAPRPDPGPQRAEAEVFREIVGKLIEAGMDPLDVGRLVADSIESNQFYVLPHPKWLNVVENRMKRILEQEDPIGVQPEGGMGIELPQTSD